MDGASPRQGQRTLKALVFASETTLAAGTPQAAPARKQIKSESAKGPTAFPAVRGSGDAVSAGLGLQGSGFPLLVPPATAVPRTPLRTEVGGVGPGDTSSYEEEGEALETSNPRANR